MNPDELPDFPLAPWELPPDSTEPLVAPATMRLKCGLYGRTTDWLARVVRLDEEEGELFVRAQTDSGGGSWWFGTLSLRKHKGEWLQEISSRLHQARSPKGFRHLRLQQGATHWMMSVNENGGNFRLSRRAKDNVAWRKKWPFDLERASSSQVHAELRRSWDDETSDLNFVWRWTLMSLDERLGIMMSWKRGDERAFHSTALLVLRALGPQVSSFPLSWTYLPEGEMWLLAEGAPGNEDVVASGVIEVWEKALLEVFSPDWNDELGKRHLCAHFHGFLRERFTLSLDSPTFHEQLEAARELAIWLDERESQSELDAPTLSRLRDTLR